MSAGVVCALRGGVEGNFLEVIARSEELAIARRLSEINEVVAAIGASVGSVAVVDVASGVDRMAISSIRKLGGICVVLCPQDQEEHWQELGAFACDIALPAAVIAEQVAGFARDGMQPVGAQQTQDEAEFAGVQRNAKVIMVSGPARSGVSTVALNLADSLARTGASVVLVDANIWQPSIALMLGLSPDRHGLATLMRRFQDGVLHQGVVAEIAQELTPQGAGPTMRVVTGIAAPRQWREVTEDGLRELLRILGHTSDYVVVDTPPYLAGEGASEWEVGPDRNAVFQAVVSVADHLIAIGNPDVVSMSRFVNFLQQVSDLSALEPVLVVNRMRTSAAGMRAQDSVGQVLHEYGGASQAYYLPEDTKLADRALLRAVAWAGVRAETGPVAVVQDLARALGATVQDTKQAWYKGLGLKVRAVLFPAIGSKRRHT